MAGTEEPGVAPVDKPGAPPVLRHLLMLSLSTTLQLGLPEADNSTSLLPPGREPSLVHQALGVAEVI